MTHLSATLTVENQQFRIARPGDWNDFLRFQPEKVHQAAAVQLKRLTGTYGEERSPQKDLMRQRLHQLRTHLKMQ